MANSKYDWAILRTTFINHPNRTITLEKFAEECDIPKSTLLEKARNEGWKDDRDDEYAKELSIMKNKLADKKIDEIDKYNKINTKIENIVLKYLEKFDETKNENALANIAALKPREVKELMKIIQSNNELANTAYNEEKENNNIAEVSNMSDDDLLQKLKKEGIDI